MFSHPSFPPPSSSEQSVAQITTCRLPLPKPAELFQPFYAPAFILTERRLLKKLFHQHKMKNHNGLLKFTRVLHDAQQLSRPFRPIRVQSPRQEHRGDRRAFSAESQEVRRSRCALRGRQRRLGSSAQRFQGREPGIAVSVAARR